MGDESAFKRKERSGGFVGWYQSGIGKCGSHRSLSIYVGTKINGQR